MWRNLCARVGIYTAEVPGSIPGEVDVFGSMLEELQAFDLVRTIY
jgi:hypothetical protein